MQYIYGRTVSLVGGGTRKADCCVGGVEKEKIMLTCTELRSRLQRAFTPVQAELIASLHVEMHD